PNRGRQRATDKYRFNREARTEVDEEQQIQTDRQQTADLDRQLQTADSDSGFIQRIRTANSDSGFRQRIQIADSDNEFRQTADLDRAADQTADSHAEPDKCIARSEPNIKPN
ncbi:hypothetical protein Tco_0311312, partial [Tanacetum coccineum]